jgi:hypothetical protein
VYAGRDIIKPNANGDQLNMRKIVYELLTFVIGRCKLQETYMTQCAPDISYFLDELANDNKSV